MTNQIDSAERSSAKTKTALLVVSAVIFMIITVAVWLSLSYSAPYNYAEDCFYAHQEDFDNLVSYAEKLYSENSLYAEINTDNAPDEIKEFLEDLQKQYGKDSPYPVFSAVDVRFDHEGDMMLYVRAKNEKLRSGDGMNSPDIRFYYLIYIDENYDGKVTFSKDKPFFESWYTGSSDTYSG